MRHPALSLRCNSATRMQFCKGVAREGARVPPKSGGSQKYIRGGLVIWGLRRKIGVPPEMCPPRNQILATPLQICILIFMSCSRLGRGDAHSAHSEATTKMRSSLHAKLRLGIGLQALVLLSLLTSRSLVTQKRRAESCLPLHLRLKTASFSCQTSKLELRSTIDATIVRT